MDFHLVDRTRIGVSFARRALEAVTAAAIAHQLHVFVRTLRQLADLHQFAIDEEIVSAMEPGGGEEAEGWFDGAAIAEIDSRLPHRPQDGAWHRATARVADLENGIER